MIIKELQTEGGIRLDTNHDESTLNEVQQGLLQEIREKFDPQKNVADCVILYEITDFREEIASNAEFWSQYEDWYEFGYDYSTGKQTLIDRLSKNSFYT